MAWTPPPNWPPPPTPGWSPPAGWQPDPSWGPPPEDWVFWPATGPTIQIDAFAGGGGGGGWAPQQPVSPWAAAVPTKPSPRVRAGAIVVIVGGLLAFVGAFGTWVRASGLFGVSLSSGGMSGGHDGPFVLVLGLLAVAFGTTVLVAPRLPNWLAFVSIAVGALLAIITVSDAVDVHHKVQTLKRISPYVRGHVGWGLVLSVIASFVVILGSVACINVGDRRS